MTAHSKIVLHYVAKSRAERVAWLLNELELEYELKTYDNDTKPVPDPELVKVHPVGRAPVLEIDDHLLTEASFISEYLISKYGKDSELAPKSEEEELEIKNAVHHCEASVLPLLVLLVVSDNVREKAPYLISGVAKRVADGQDEGYADPNLKINLEYLEAKLSKNGSDFIVGDHLTAADIMYSFMFTLAPNHIPQQTYPKLNEWIDKMRKRPAFSKR